MKDLKISKELIKAVLQKETETLSKDFNFTINENYIEFSDDGEMQFEYCIYKFAFECKEWAYNKGYIIIDFIDVEKDEFWSCRIYKNGFNDGYDEEIAYCMECYDAVIKASEWILNEDNK